MTYHIDTLKDLKTLLENLNISPDGGETQPLRFPDGSKLQVIVDGRKFGDVVSLNKGAT